MKLENICRHCGNKFPKGRSFGAHVTNCKCNPKRKEIDNKIANTKRLHKTEYKFNCEKCNKEFTILLTKNRFVKKRYKRFCSYKCANSHFVSKETKKKIGNSLRGKPSPMKGKILKPKILKSKVLKIKEEKPKNFCKTCNKEIYIDNKSGYCKTCLSKNPEYRLKLSNATKGKCGGYRQKGGRGKQG